MLDLLDADELPQIILSDAVTTLRTLSRNLTPPWHVVLADGKSADAVELLFIYQEKAKKLFQGRDGETDALLESWEEVLEGLSGKPQSLVGVLDWVTKEYLLREFCKREGLEWGHSWLESQDLEFHHIDPQRSLGLALANVDGFWDGMITFIDHATESGFLSAQRRSQLLVAERPEEALDLLDEAATAATQGMVW